MFRAHVRMTHRLDTGQQVWEFRVTDSQGTLYAVDNTADLPKMHETATRLVRTMNEMLVRGFELKQPKWLRKEI